MQGNACHPLKKSFQSTTKLAKQYGKEWSKLTDFCFSFFFQLFPLLPVLLLLDPEQNKSDANPMCDAGKLITKGMIDISGQPNLAAGGGSGKTRSKIGNFNFVTKQKANKQSIESNLIQLCQKLSPFFLVHVPLFECSAV